METSYKEKYEQALAKAKEQYNYPCMRSCMGILEEIFPELAESEDEKIRKEIVGFLDMFLGTHITPTATPKQLKGWIAWLENIPYTIDHEKREGFQLGYKACLERQGEQKPTDSYCKENCKGFQETGKCFADGECKAKREAEQKPADKIEPKFKVGDKIYLKQEYRMPDDDTPIANTVKEIKRIDDKHYRFDWSYIFIEDQDKYELVEQKPEENKGNLEGISPKWSVEDEENFCSVYLDVKSARQNTVNSLSGELKEQEQKRMDEVISWLRSLKGRVLPKQEWNEEDEQHIDSLLKRLDALCRNKFERTRFAISEDRDWLKSLRPQNKWKPSELQLGCLSDAIEHYNSLGYPASKLKELLDDLKKLNEGEI